MCGHVYPLKSSKEKPSLMMKENIAWFILHEVGYQNETILNRIESYRTGSSIIGAIACAVIVACVGLPTMSRILISVLMLASTLLCIIIVSWTRNSSLGVEMFDNRAKVKDLSSAIDIVIDSRTTSLRKNIVLDDRILTLWNSTLMLFGIALVLFVSQVMA